MGQLKLFQKAESLQIKERYDPSMKVNIFHGDRIELLRQIRESNQKAELIVTSPPYNTGKEYETKTSLDVYVEDQRKTIEAAVNILSKTGSICWQVGHHIKGSGKNKEAFPLDLVLYPIFKEFDLNFQK